MFWIYGREKEEEEEEEEEEWFSSHLRMIFNPAGWPGLEVVVGRERRGSPEESQTEKQTTKM